MSDIENSHGAIQDEFLELMNVLGKTIDELLNGDKPKEVGFVLLMFSLGEPTSKSRMNYISNSNRKDVVVALKEFIANFEGRKMKEPTEVQ